MPFVAQGKPALPLGSETLNMSKVLVALIVGALPGSNINAGLKPGAYIRKLVSNEL